MTRDRTKSVVRERAKYRCEYCMAPEAEGGYTFHLEHILPKAAGGGAETSNLALSCWSCNHWKWHHQTGVDQVTGETSRLFNPRLDKWSEHFRLAEHFFIEGKTPIGRATEHRLQLNSAQQLRARLVWWEAGIFP